MPRPNVEAERRDQILRATCGVIAASGFRDLRLADVAREAGVSSGTIHYYFDTKRDLVHAAFEYNFQHSLQRRAELLRSEADPLTLLEEVIDSYLPDSAETVQAWRVWVELWVDGLREQQVRELNDHVYGEWRRMVVGLVRDAQDQGLLRSEDPVRLANTLISMLDGMAIQVLLGSSSMTLDRMRTTWRAYLRELTTTAPKKRRNTAKT